MSCLYLRGEKLIWRTAEQLDITVSKKKDKMPHKFRGKTCQIDPTLSLDTIT